MASSGTYNFALPNSGVIYEAFDRIQKRPTEVDRHMLLSARMSLNLELLSWSNETFNFWKTTSGSISLVAGQAAYLLPANLSTLEELYYSQVNGLGPGVNSDRIMVPMERTQYAELTNKLQPGIPTQYWYLMSAPQQTVTVWQVASAAPATPGHRLDP